MSASPAARRLRTQWTGPYAPITYRRLSISTTATGAVRSWPEVRPRTVRSTFGPIGRPRPMSRRVRGLDRRTIAGAWDIDDLLGHGSVIVLVNRLTDPDPRT